MKGVTQHPGITRHAKILGCSAGHLHAVVTGDRHSPDLLQRYNELLAKEAAADPFGKDREIFESVCSLAESLLPEYKAASTDEQRAAIRAELLDGLPADFADSCMRLFEGRFSMRDMMRHAAAILPFLSQPRLAESAPAPNPKTAPAPAPSPVHRLMPDR